MVLRVMAAPTTPHPGSGRGVVLCEITLEIGGVPHFYLSLWLENSRRDAIGDVGESLPSE